MLLDSFTVALTPSGAVVGLGSAVASGVIVGCGFSVSTGISGVTVGCSAITKYFFST